MNIVLDSCILGKLCHPKSEENKPIALFIIKLLEKYNKDVNIIIPEISDYELRRELIRLAKKNNNYTSINRLDQFKKELEYLPLNTKTIQKAAELWAEARICGKKTCDNKALDGDVIISAQTLEVNGTIITTNTKHFSMFVAAKTFEEINKLYP